MTIDTIKKYIYGYQQTFLTVLRLTIYRQIAWRKAVHIIENLAACLLRKPPPHYPPVIQVDITNMCNLRCPGCLTGQKVYPTPPGMMDLGRFNACIDEVKADTAIAILYNSGEPMLHPELVEMVTCLTKNRIASIVSTNGHFLASEKKAEQLVRAGLSLLIVSLSGATQETYEQYHRGGHLDQVIEGIQRISEAKKKLNRRTPLIMLRLLIMDHNKHELGDMKKLAKHLACDTIDIRYAKWQLKTLNRKTSAAFPQSFTPEYRRNKICLWPWLISVINWNGDVVPCCFYHLDLPKMGNAFRPEKLRGAWWGGAYTAFRGKMRNGQHAIALCRGCPAETGFQTRFTRQKQVIFAETEKNTPIEQ